MKPIPLDQCAFAIANDYPHTLPLHPKAKQALQCLLHCRKITDVYATIPATAHVRILLKYLPSSYQTPIAKAVLPNLREQLATLQKPKQ